MADLLDGFTTSDDNPDHGGIPSNEQLAARALARAAEVTPQERQVLASDEEIRAQVIDAADTEVSVQGALTTSDDVDRHGNTAADRARIQREAAQLAATPLGQEIAAEAELDRARGATDSQKAAAYDRQQDLEILSGLTDTMLEMDEDSVEVAQAYAYTRLLRSEAGRAELAANGYLMDADELGYWSEVLDRERVQVGTLRAGMNDAQDNSDRAEIAQSLIRDHNVHPTQALNFLTDTSALVRDLYGLDWPALPPSDYEAYALAAWDWKQSDVSSFEDFKVKAEILGVQDGSTYEGFTQFSPATGKHENVTGGDGIEWERPSPEASLAKVRERLARGTTTHDDVRAQVLGKDARTREYEAMQAKATKLFGAEEARKLVR